MRVVRLRISGFRRIQEADIRLLEQSVLVGPNGCGKSTIVDAISRWTACGASSYCHQIQQRPNPIPYPPRGAHRHEGRPLRGARFSPGITSERARERSPARESTFPRNPTDTFLYQVRHCIKDDPGRRRRHPTDLSEKEQAANEVPLAALETGPAASVLHRLKTAAA
ncbi:MAG: AAA family ATPase [Limisphaerales bacterium]